MRTLLFALAASLLALSGCGKKEATGNTAAVDEAVTAEDFTANDVTAIDAATGADANMAADVDINVVNIDGDEDDSPSATRRTPRSSPATANASRNTSEPAEEPDAPPATQPAETNSD